MQTTGISTAMLSPSFSTFFNDTVTPQLMFAIDCQCYSTFHVTNKFISVYVSPMSSQPVYIERVREQFSKGLGCRLGNFRLP